MILAKDKSRGVNLTKLGLLGLLACWLAAGLLEGGLEQRSLTRSMIGRDRWMIHVYIYI